MMTSLLVAGAVALVYLVAGLYDRLSGDRAKLICRWLPFIGYKTLSDSTGAITVAGWCVAWLSALHYIRPVMTINWQQLTEEAEDVERQADEGTDEGSGSNTTD